MNLLESLNRWTTVVADTGDIEAIAEHKPQDATTNPSLLLQAAQKPQYQDLVAEAMGSVFDLPGDEASRTEAFIDKLFVSFGCDILQFVPGRVSTEVDPGLSFDTEGTLAKARRLIDLYERPESAATGSSSRLPAPGRAFGPPINWSTRHPLQFNPVVQFRPGRGLRRGRRDPDLALRWPHLRLVPKGRGGKDIPPDEDPGVASVTRIYDYFKKFDFRTQVMGASFRKVDQIVRLAGCDLLTISPDLLEQMENVEGSVPRRLNVKRPRHPTSGRFV